MELIQYSGRNWVIQEESETELILINSFDNKTICKINVPVDSPLLKLPLPEDDSSGHDLKRKVIGNPIMMEFDIEEIERLSTKKKGTKKLKYKKN